MKTRIIYATLVVTILCISIISCRTTPDEVVLALSQVEDCMENNPDSALILLKRIPNSEYLHGKAQADYALLMTQAMDKNYIKPTSDSLIALAVGYYGSHGDDVMAKGKAFFYCGRVMSELKRYEDAMRYTLLSKKIFEGSNEYKMLGLISEEVGNLNWKQDIIGEALSNFQTSHEYFVLANDMLSVSYALRNIGRAHLSLDSKSDSAYSYYQQALQIARKHNCKSEFILLQELGMIYRARKDYEKSEYYLLQSLKINEMIESFSEVYLSLGYTYLKMNNVSEAEKYLRLSTKSINIFTQADAYNSLYKLEKYRNNLQVAIEYKEKSDSLGKITSNSGIRETMAELQKKYVNEKLQKENLQIKIRYKNILIFCLVLFFIIVLLVCYYTYKSRNSKRKMRDIEQKIIRNEVEIMSYQQDIASYQQDLAGYDRLQTESESHQLVITRLMTELAKLDGKVSVLSKYNRELNSELREIKGDSHMIDSEIEDLYLTAFRTYLSLRKGTCVELSNKEWERIFKLFNFIYRDFIIRLRANYPNITKHDIEICCLMKIGLSNDELSRIFSTTAEAVTKGKNRLKKRLDLAGQDTLEEFVHRY